MKNNLNVVSLFSGCGGMDLGFEGDFEILKKSMNTSKTLIGILRKLPKMNGLDYLKQDFIPCL